MYKTLLQYLEAYKNPRKSLAFFLLIGAYVLTALISNFAYDFISPVLIWPAAGVALAVLYLEGVSLWPAIFLASFAINVLQHVPFLLAIVLAMANSLENIVGVYILRRFRFSPMLSKLRDVIILTCVALSISFISPILGSIGLLIQGSSLPEVLRLLEPWWLGKALSHMVLGAFIMRWCYRWPARRTTTQIIQWVLSFLVLGGVSYIVFWTPINYVGVVPVLYALLVPLIWMTLSIGPRGVTLALFFMTCVSITGTLFGYAPAVSTTVPLTNQLIQVELFNLILTIVFLIFVSSEEGRKDASLELQTHVVQLEKAINRISSEDRAKNEFLAILAHELRNPLAPIKSSLELLRIEGADPKKFDAHLVTIEDRVMTMSRLLDDLLDISRISQKKFKLQKELVDIFSIVRNSAKTTQSLMHEKKHTLTLVMPNEPVWISGDTIRLEQVFINLLTNAAKYTEPEGSIRVVASIEQEQVVVRVKDSGMGIPPSMIERIFEPFLQVRQARQSEGLGIGLSLVKQLLDLHDGVITAESAGVGFGSEFTVKIPIPRIVPKVTAVEKNKGALSSSSFSIFLVDDNVLAADALAKLLTYSGHRVTAAYSGTEALQKFPDPEPDVLILDIGLPDMNGYTLLQQLKDMGATSFSIALTGFGQDSDKERAKAAGFDRHITKPVSVVEVEALLPHKNFEFPTRISPIV